MNYYFAYGSNLSEEQMKVRCPDSKLLGVATLGDYKLDFTTQSERWGGGAADVVPAPGGVVWGVLYSLSNNDLERLDIFEGHPVHYARERVVVEGKDGEVEAYIYKVVDKLSFQNPSISYIEILRAAAKALGFSKEYQDYLGGIGG